MYVSIRLKLDNLNFSNAPNEFRLICNHSNECSFGVRSVGKHKLSLNFII